MKMRGLSRLAMVIVALFVAVAAYPVQSYADKPTYAKAYPAWTDLMKWADPIPMFVTRGLESDVLLRLAGVLGERN